MLLIMCAVNRIIMFTTIDKNMAEFDFTSTIAKLRDA